MLHQQTIEQKCFLAARIEEEAKENVRVHLRRQDEIAK